jgi:hypothetical protein
VLWKADVYRTEEERRRAVADTLSLEDVARIFNADLAAKGAGFRFDLDRLDDPGLHRALGEVYAEAVPIGAGPSVFDAYR